MPLVTRASIPEEFFDVTSAMLLRQPQPQFLHAQLFFVALGASFNPGSLLGFLPSREIGGEGALYADLQEQQLIIDDPIMSEAITVVPELGQKGIGHTVRLNRPKFVSTTYTEASRLIAASTVISTTPSAIASEQVPLTVKRWAGPYDSGQAAVAPIGIDRLDAQRSVHNLAGAIGTQLVWDFHKFVDSVVVSMFDSGANVIYPQGFAQDTDFKAAGDGPFSYEMVLRSQKKHDDLSIPTFANGNRVMILTTQQINDLAQDDLFVKFAQYNPPLNPVLRKSYFKSVAGYDIYKSTTLNQVLNGNSPNISVQYGQAFGPGMVGAGIDEMPRTAFSTADNYGEQALVIWLMYAGWGVLDNRFGLSLRSD